MGEVLYQTDSYLKEFSATVVSVSDSKFVVLDKTAFYPTSGGQQHDTGTLVGDDGTTYPVVFVGKFSGNISHEIDPAGKPEIMAGQKVTGMIDWNRRYTFMKYHTATHILAALINKETGALITGNQLGLDKTRIDFSVGQFDRDLLTSYEQKVNEVIKENIPIEVSFITRAEIDANPSLVKLAKGLPEEIKEVRMVKIGDIDVQPDGGTHVARTGEIGSIKIVDLQNKGKDRRRIYFELTSES
ncbi:alanyl-tRNA editing protein [Candidatus Woesearchaeota archaeon]|nr:alanyl-tRNA editing protein [Candidatus Woesearchaeota archaeon]HIH38086.1 alanyl-tRNA editing protein [Candidatus Woesearchaeota archaeon]HIH48366.1 alanyl-tRNA editing protein [Candidatus Woesearchaeota archaeon]HIJ03181.1 alanyl-tRNA editing protein [Candidatus Woesearchaeota archaeon]